MKPTNYSATKSAIEFISFPFVVAAAAALPTKQATSKTSNTNHPSNTASVSLHFHVRALMLLLLLSAWLLLLLLLLLLPRLPDCKPACLLVSILSSLILSQSIAKRQAVAGAVTACYCMFVPLPPLSAVSFAPVRAASAAELYAVALNESLASSGARQQAAAALQAQNLLPIALLSRFQAIGA